MNSASQSTIATVIPAYSKRQVMDWSLVLASQDIPTTIVECDPGRWGLEVQPQDYERAREAIRLYRLENRRWTWRQPLPWSEATFHWGALGWCFLLIMVHWLSTNYLGYFRTTGVFYPPYVRQYGEWWRAFTAILLHADLGHLLSNVTVGLLLVGLTMARYGAAVGLLAAYLCGAAGNLAGLLLYPNPYNGLGASGMVMGALGLIAIPPLSHWALHPRAFKSLLQAVFAGIFLFLMLGVNPSSDVIAHLGGFVAGCLSGLILTLVPRRLLDHPFVDAVVWIVLLTLFIGTSWAALTAPVRATGASIP